MKVISETLETPVNGEYDVIVAGGGPAGIGAAVSAARNGMRTLLVERYGFLGGMWTAGLVNPMFDTNRKGGIVKELVEGLKARNAWGGWSGICFNFEEMKLVLDRMTTGAGVELLLHTQICGAITDAGSVKGIIVQNKSGRQAYLAKVIIDCTGDGDVAAMSGASFSIGREKDGLTQPMTLMFRIGNIDFMQQRSTDLYNLIVKAVERHQLDYAIPYTRPYILMFPGQRSAVVQLTHVRSALALNDKDMTEAEIAGRRQIMEAYELFRSYIPELAGVTLEQIAPQIGVRETRRIHGQYTLTLEDLLEGRRYADGIAICAFGIDIHQPDSEGQEVYDPKAYHIPYRSLVPLGVNGLLVAGRCISGTYEAHASYRVTGNCTAMGEAAGTAAAIAVESGCEPGDIAVEKLKERLERQGVLL
ncbi:MAG: FAD-dependent oxidoreductase [Paenibacillaceae bacterium]|nr:FAD-dependent oxidoreductase [Paenibacillaceae bacterium]